MTRLGPRSNGLGGGPKARTRRRPRSIGGLYGAVAHRKLM